MANPQLITRAQHEQAQQRSSWQFTQRGPRCSGDWQEIGFWWAAPRLLSPARGQRSENLLTSWACSHGELESHSSPDGGQAGPSTWNLPSSETNQPSGKSPCDLGQGKVLAPVLFKCTSALNWEEHFFLRLKSGTLGLQPNANVFPQLWKQSSN